MASNEKFSVTCMKVGESIIVNLVLQEVKSTRKTWFEATTV